MGSIRAWGALGSGGQVLPRPSVLRWAISWAFLCGVCMFSPCSQGVSSTKNTNRKNMQKEQNTPVRPLPRRTVHLVPGRLQAAHCSWGVLEEGQSRMGKGRRFILFLITATSGAPQVLCRLHIFTCVAVCSVSLV